MSQIPTGPKILVLAFSIFTDRWPLRKDRNTELYHDNSDSLRVVGDTQGRIVITGKGLSFVSCPIILSIPDVKMFDKLGIPKASRPEWAQSPINTAALDIRIEQVDGTNSITLTVNKTDVPHTKGDSAVVNVLASYFTVMPEKIVPSFEPELIEDDDERMLLNIAQELEDRITSDKEFENVRASLPLRQLLVDGGGLAAKIARRFGIVLEFELVEWGQKYPELKPSHKEEGTHLLHSTIDPTLFRSMFSDGIPIVKLNQARFMDFGVFMMDGHKASIMTLIKTVAEVMGGVHYGPPTRGGEKKQVIIEFEKKVSQGGGKTSLHTLVSVGRITLTAIKPLMEAILSKQTKS